MTDQREFDLLVDLATLLKKYGPESFERLAAAISSPEFTKDLSDVLLGAAATARSTKQIKNRTKPKRSGTSIEASLEIMRHNDPQKYEIIIKFYHALLARTVLPSLRDIKYFAVDCGLPEIRSHSRQEAIVRLVRSLLSFSLKELNEKLLALRQGDRSDRSLQAWSDLILDTGKKDLPG